MRNVFDLSMDSMLANMQHYTPPREAPATFVSELEVPEDGSWRLIMITSQGKFVAYFALRVIEGSLDTYEIQLPSSSEQ